LGKDLPPDSPFSATTSQKVELKLNDYKVKVYKRLQRHQTDDIVLHLVASVKAGSNKKVNFGEES